MSSSPAPLPSPLPTPASPENATAGRLDQPRTDPEPQPEAPGRDRVLPDGTGWLALLAVLCIAIAVAAYLIFVRTHGGQRADAAVTQGRDIVQPRARAASARILETISVGSLALGGLGLAFIGLVRNRWRLAVGVLVSVLGAVVTTELLKKVILPRPILTSQQLYVHNSLPSGHTTVATALAAGLILVTPNRYRIAATIVGVLYAGGVGMSTVVLGAHRPSDVVAGYAVAVGWAAVVALGLAATGSGQRDEPRGPTLESIAVLLLACAVAAVAGLAGLAWVVQSERTSLHTVPFGEAFIVSLIALASTAMVLLGSLAAALQPLAHTTHNRRRDRSVRRRGAASPI